MKEGSEPYDPLADLVFVFKNMQCTLPANNKLASWCIWAVDNQPNILRFVYRAGQEYTAHGGCGVYTYDRWLKQLKRNSLKVLEEA